MTSELKNKRNELREALALYAMLIRFTKVDGSERTMHCTLNPDLMPKSEVTKERVQSKTYSEDVFLRVWDLDLKAWRSFIIENIISASILI